MPRPLAIPVTLFATVAMVLLTAPAAGAVPAVTVSPATVPPGGSFTVSGSGCWDPEEDPFGEFEPQWIVIVSTAFGPGGADVTDAAGGPWSVTIKATPGMTGNGSVDAYCRLTDGRTFNYPRARVTVQAAVPVPAPPPPIAAPRATAPPAPRSTAAAPATKTAPPATSAPMVPTPSPTLSPTPSPTSGPPTSGPAANCVDCAAMTSGEPLSAGRELRLAYTGFQPGEAVTVVLHSTPVTLGTFTADATGTVTAPVTLPADTVAGQHTLTFSGPGSGDLVSLPFRVSAQESNPSAGVRKAAAPSSDGGSTALWLGGAGLAMASLAVMALLLLRRRKQALIAS